MVAIHALHSGLETIFQVTANAILLFYANSTTKARQGLSSLFERDTDFFMGFSMPPELVIAILLAINFLSFIKVQMNGIIEGYASNYSFLGKVLILLGITCASLERIASPTFYFSTTLGLFNLLHHFQGEQYQTEKLINYITYNKFPLYWIAEMFVFQGILDDIAPHIYPLTNISLSQLQRGSMIASGPFEDGAQDHIYVPPPLELYTGFSLGTHFFVFWGILGLQTFTIFVVDMIWVKNIPKTATIWERIVHAIQKSSFPFPYTNWHQENGSCLDHLRRKEAAQHEVLVSILINLLFNMILLVPLPIFCKI